MNMREIIDLVEWTMIYESRSAPLYHATSLTGLIGIIESNKITGSDEVQRNRPKGFPCDAGVSLTRSIHFAKQWAKVSSDRICSEICGEFSDAADASPCERAEAAFAGATGAIIVLDQNRLAQRFRLTPVDDFMRRGKEGGLSDGHVDHAESEELLSGDLHGVTNYITKIIILANPHAYSQFKAHAIGWTLDNFKTAREAAFDFIKTKL